MEENPYQAPADLGGVAAPLSPDEEVRKAHLNAEASVQGIGSLMFLGSLLVLVSFILSVSSAFQSSSSGGTGIGAAELLLILFISAVAIFQLVVGWCLRRLRPWTKIPAMVLAALSLFAFPVGTVIGLYLLLILAGKKGRFVLSPEYAGIRERTPHIKYRTPLWLWLLLIAFVLLVVFLVFFARVS